jgi:hypothetical protein
MVYFEAALSFSLLSFAAQLSNISKPLTRRFAATSPANPRSETATAAERMQG